MVIAVGCWKEKTQEMGRRYITAPPVSVFCFIQGSLCMHVHVCGLFLIGLYCTLQLK